MIPYQYPYMYPRAENPQIQPQPIQSLNLQPQSQAVCYFVRDNSEMGNINLMPNIVYIGINSAVKELYLRKLNNDGNIDSETYKLESGKQEKNDVQLILDRLTVIEDKLEARNVGKSGSDVHNQPVQKRS